MTFHLLYTSKDHQFHDEYKQFGCFAEAEIWLVIIEAVYWEIGLPDNYFELIKDK